MSTFAGSGLSSSLGDYRSATSASFYLPVSLDIIPFTGDVYIADWNVYRIRKVDGYSGIITTIAGTGVGGNSGDGGLAIDAKIYNPTLCLNTITGDVYFSDPHVVRKITFSTGIITTIAGTESGGYNCDNCEALSSKLYYPRGISYNPITEELYISDYGNHRIRKINSSGIITTVAGTGTSVSEFII